MAAYLYLPRKPGDHAARMTEIPGGMLIDFAADGRAIGIEIVFTCGCDAGSGE
jgi:uncharacterized protein YuzE